MNRRIFVALIGGALAVALARAQPKKAGALRRIVIATDLESVVHRKALVETLRVSGWIEGRDFVFVDSGFMYGHPFDEVARRVLDLKPDVILSVNTAYTLALHRQTKTIPIVMWASGYPVEVGLAESLARPGKNVTGLSLYAGTGVWGKLVELLREAKPGAKSVVVLWGYVPPAHPIEEIEPCYREFREAERALGIGVRIVDVARADQVGAALKAIDTLRPDGLVVTSGPGLWSTRPQVLEYATKRRLPTIADFPQPPENTHARPLLVYAPAWGELFPQAATYIGRILGGMKPGDLPIQQPARFELEINMKAASAIGLKLPQSLLLRADRVIE